MTNIIKKSWPALYVGLVLISALILSGAGVTKDSDGPEQTDAKPFDGYSILLSGNWKGQIEPCGCTEKQLGGLDRRTETIGIVAPDEQSRLILETGPLIEKLDRQNQLKFDTFLQAMKTVGYDAVCMTAAELNLLHSHTVDLDASLRPPVICSNMPEDELAGFGGVQYFVKELKYKGKTRKAYVFGIAEGYDTDAGKEMKLIEPVVAVKDLIKKLKLKDQKNAIVILLSQTENDKLVEAVQAVKEIDLFVCRGFGDEPQKRFTTKTMFACDTGSLSKYLTRFSMAADKPVSPGNLKLDGIPIHSSFNLDKNVVKLMDEYQLRLMVENLISENNERMPLEDNNMFAGSASCGAPDCHPKVYEKWSTLRHSQAVPTLEKVNRNFDPECMECHTVGLRYESGYKSQEETPELAAVGCEMCHGPGMIHNEYPNESYSKQPYTPCEQCHNDYHSPEFQDKREEYFEKIKHWDYEGRKYWD